MNKNKITRNYAILNAWRKIQKYIRKNYANAFQNITYIYVNETNTTRTELGIMPDGKSFITEYDKLRNKIVDCDFPNRPLGNKSSIYVNNTIQPYHTKMIEPVVLNWSEVKARLEKRIQQEHEIYNFKILDTNPKNTEDHIAALFAKTDFSNMKCPWLANVIKLSLEYLTLDGLDDALRSTQIPEEILNICENELQTTNTKK